ncbi:site-specific integrase [Senegalia massiliensis]|uniref:Site-specific integrase n=1 Tax=Senegalia massiliensis TaxID=1720316 RepID=A0A845QTD0_9CLOT|nr:site-specific integrase [Senegalia massiliensis]NBI06087.1 site-specific integrase [Senegalia massiliensis]
MNFVSPIRDKKQIEIMKIYLKSKSKRDYLMFVLGINSALRISDILGLHVNDVWQNNKPREFIKVREQKTGKLKRFPITKNLSKALHEYMKEYNPSAQSYLFFSKKGYNKPLSRQQASSIISKTANYIGIKEPINTHSMRKTWGYWAYKNGVSIALIMEALNHSSISNTKKYLGITQQDLDNVYLNLNL